MAARSTSGCPVGELSKIGWTDHTFNPWIGCARVSPACTHCYAETDWGQGGRRARVVWGVNGTRSVTSDANWKLPLRWDRAAAEAGRPALVFCASLADVFEARDDLVEPRARLFDLIDRTPHLRWLLLTKRIELVADMVPRGWTDLGQGTTWWPRNVWIGTTVEDQRRAEERLPFLVELPAPVRFVSAEPLLGRLNIGEWLVPSRLVGRVDWLIAGGESGPEHRPLDLDAVRALRDQCERAGVPFYFKQVGGRTPTAGGDLLDGRRHAEFPPEAERGVAVRVR